MESADDNDGSWVFDYDLIEDIAVPGGGGDLLPSLDSPSSLWPSLSFPHTAPLSVEFDCTFENCDTPKESCRKRLRAGSCNVSGTKACREKMRRDRLNDRFMELGALLDPGRPKLDKSVILADAVRMVTELREEAQKLKETNDSLEEKIHELKAEKNELRNEKQSLKTEKENLVQKMKALSAAAPSLLLPPPPISATFSAPGQVGGNKLVPFVGYPGVSMWQFMPPAAVDTSQDHVLRPPVA